MSTVFVLMVGYDFAGRQLRQRAAFAFQLLDDLVAGLDDRQRTGRLAWRQIVVCRIAVVRRRRRIALRGP